MMAQCNPDLSRQGLASKCRELLAFHNYPRPNRMSDGEVICTFEKGILLDNSLYWLDKNRICCEKFARGITVIWGSTPQYWTYKKERLSSGQCIEVAELLNVCWLEVYGHFETKLLSLNTEYEIVFDIKMLPCSYGWERNATFMMTTPEGYKVVTEKDMNQYIGKDYQEITIGKFHVPKFPVDSYYNSKVEFRLQCLNPEWKRGFVVRGVIVRPARWA